MVNISLYWNDLTLEMKDKILRAFGDNCNWDTFSLALPGRKAWTDSASGGLIT